MSDNKKLTSAIQHIIRSPVPFINDKIDKGYKFLKYRLNETKVLGIIMLLGSFLSLFFCSSYTVLRREMDTNSKEFDTIIKLLDQKMQRNCTKDAPTLLKIKPASSKTVHLLNESLPEKKIDSPIAISMHIKAKKALQTHKIKDLKIIFSISWKPIRDLTQYPIIGKGNQYIDTSIVMDSSRITKLLPQKYGLSLNSFEAPFMELGAEQEDLVTSRRRINIAYLDRTESTESADSSVPIAPTQFASNLWRNSLAAFEEERQNNIAQRSNNANQEIQVREENVQPQTASQKTRQIVRWLFSKFTKTTYARFNILNTLFIRISD